MHLSIVVPVYNEASSLPRFLAHLRALRAQDEPNRLECVLVDGGSNDATPEILRDSGMPWIAAERGRAAQMNAGAAVTRGDALLFLHADTLLPAGGLRTVREVMSAGAAGGFFRVRLDSQRPLLRYVGRLISARSRLTGIATGDQAIFVSRTAFTALGGYAPLPLFEDVELMRRLKHIGRVVPLPATVTTSARRWEQHGPWRTILRMWTLRLLYYAGMGPDRLARYYGGAR